ncbi:ribonuclease H-like domain-containing protein [Tanacetum coccineum]
MSARDKTGLGYGTQLNEMSNNSETDSEISLSVFVVRSSVKESTPANDKFSKADGYDAVPPLITGNFLTPRADISFAGLDEYAIRKKIIESKTTELYADTSKSKTSETVVDKIGQTSKKAGIGFKKIKACFVCKSTDHLIKDCDFYDKKSPEPKLKNVANTGQRERVVKPVWDYGKRVNHQNFSKNLKYPHAKRTFNPSAVLTRAGLVNTDRSNVSTARSISTVRPVYTVRPVSTARPLASKIAQSNSVIRPNHPRLDIVRPKASNSPIKRSYFTQPVYRPKDLKPDVKTFGIKNMTTVGTRAVVSKGKVENVLKKDKWVWRPKMNYQDHVYKYNGSYMLKKFEYGNPDILLQAHAVVDSGCSSHMTGNKAYLSEYEDSNGGFVAFGSDTKGGKITGKGKIKTANLDFDDVYFVDELNFKLLDESQVVLRAPRKDGVYSLDLKNIVPSGGLEKQLNHNVKIIRCDNGTEFKNYVMNEFCAKKGIKREFSVARTPQQNGVAERKNRTLIEAARTMLADSLLPIPFWAEAVNTACYVLNRVLVTKPQNKTPYELLIGKSPSISFMRLFGCPLTILNTLDSLGKFDGKSDEGYLLGYFTSCKAFIVYNKRTKRVEENLHINFLKDQPNVAGTGPNWMFDLDFLTNSMNYIPVSVENQVIVDAGTQDSYVAGSSGKDKGPTQEYILLPLQPHRIRFLVKDVMPEDEQVWQDELEMMVTQELVGNAMNDESRQAFEEEKRRIASQKKAAQATSTNQLSTARPFVSTDRSFVSTDRSNTPNVSAASTSTGANADESSFVYLGGKIPIDASTLPNADLPIDPNMPDLEDASDTLPNDGIFNGAYDDDEDVGAVADFYNMDNTIAVSPIPTLRIHKDHLKGQILGDPTSAVQTREEPNTISQPLQDESWVEAMQEELLQSNYKRDFTVYQMGMLKCISYGTIERMCSPSPPGFVDPAHPNKAYKKYNVTRVEDCKHQDTQMKSPLGELTFFLGLQVKQQPDGIFISQDKYEADILKKFDFLSIRTATTPIESNKPLVKDEDGVDMQMYMSTAQYGWPILEKMRWEYRFHQIMDFLTRSSIHYAHTVSPIVLTSFVEQFWMTTKSRTVNNISYIDSTVAGKPVTISEASIRSDLLFDDADGIDSL